MISNDSNPSRRHIVTRRAPKEWQDAFHNLCRIHPEDYFSTKEVRLQAEKLNIEISPASLQVKLARYVSKGFLNKPDRDRFRVSSLGMKFFDVLNKEETDNEFY